MIKKSSRGFLIAGIILLVLQLISALGDVDYFIKIWSNPPTTAWDLGYFLGYNIFGFAGIILLIIYSKKKRKYISTNEEKNENKFSFLLFIIVFYVILFIGTFGIHMPGATCFGYTPNYM